MSKVKGGRKKTFTNLESRRKQFDLNPTPSMKHEYHRPGSTNRKKQA